MIRILDRTVTGTEQLILEVAKDWLRVDGTTDDDLITSLITQARDLIEQYCNITITPSTITLLASPRIELCLPYGPVDSVTSVKDGDGTAVDYNYNGFCIEFQSATYSVTNPSAGGFVQTTTVYDAGVDEVPPGLMLGWKEVVAYLYENRGDDSKVMMLLTQNANLMEFRTKIWI